MAFWILTLLFGCCCGYFQFWMASRLDRKRWLLLFQPALLGMIVVCLVIWTLFEPGLSGLAAGRAAIPFGVVLAVTAGGWLLGNMKRKGRRD